MTGMIARIGGMVQRRLGWLAGIAALLAWLALLYAMFADVL